MSGSSKGEKEIVNRNKRRVLHSQIFSGLVATPERKEVKVEQFDVSVHIALLLLHLRNFSSNSFQVTLLLFVEHKVKKSIHFQTECIFFFNALELAFMDPLLQLGQEFCIKWRKPFKIIPCCFVRNPYYQLIICILEGGVVTFLVALVHLDVNTCFIVVRCLLLVGQIEKSRGNFGFRMRVISRKFNLNCVNHLAVTFRCYCL